MSTPLFRQRCMFIHTVLPQSFCFRIILDNAQLGTDNQPVRHPISTSRRVNRHPHHTSAPLIKQNISGHLIADSDLWRRQCPHRITHRDHHCEQHLAGFCHCHFRPQNNRDMHSVDGLGIKHRADIRCGRQRDCLGMHVMPDRHRHCIQQRRQLRGLVIIGGNIFVIECHALSSYRISAIVISFLAISR